MKTPDPVPLFPAFDALRHINTRDYPDLENLLNSGPDWYRQHWQWARDFLNYVGRNKADHTYTRFRSEIERFLLWVFLFKQKPIDEFRKADILEYADFCWQPPLTWITYSGADRFRFIDGAYSTNNDWKPFRLKLAKHQAGDATPDKKRYRPSQQTLVSMFTALMAFYKHLMNEELCFGNPAQLAKPDCRYLIKDAQIKEVRRLTDTQWRYVLATARDMADRDRGCERHLFIIASLKTLFLRISELAERRDWIPVMSHFWQDYDGNWWLKVYGKGRKIRDVSIPEEYIDYLRRYRSIRGLQGLPSPGDNAPLVEKIRGRGGMTARHLSRLVQEVFDNAYQAMRAEHGPEPAQKLLEASTHWLRHTGASMEVQRGRALKDLSEDLGHASMATTDTIYVQSENRSRAASGKKRTVE